MPRGRHAGEEPGRARPARGREADRAGHFPRPRRSAAAAARPHPAAYEGRSRNRGIKRPARRRDAVYPDQSGRGAGRHLPGDGPGPLRLSLRDAEHRPACRQRHVWAAAGRARHPMRAKIGESVRIFFGDAGPNAAAPSISSARFSAGSGAAGRRGRESVGSRRFRFRPATWSVELKIPPAGRYALIDHALSRVERGLERLLIIEGPKDDAIMSRGTSTPAPAPAPRAPAPR